MRKKYYYDHTCSSCGAPRRLQTKQPKSTRCHSCAGRETHIPASSPRNDARAKGDGYITKQGYHLIYHEGEYVPAHRLVIEVEPGNVVHHVDGNKLRNVDRNLYQCTRARHRDVHHQLERLSYYLIQQGLIEFDGAEYRFTTDFAKTLQQSEADPQPGDCRIDGTMVPPTITGRFK